ncbi:cupin domain-containing protein [Roseateles sp. DB2]|uniref:cupin domain-containing protein n=1 Tax=Roseateles sp. DB2 TaxID=3453717 RepID=UPI003EE9E12F
MAAPSAPLALLSRAAIEALPIQEKTHLLDANAVRQASLLSAATGMQQLGCQLMSLAPGRSSAEYHRHLYEEQCFYVLSGEGRVLIEDQWHALQAGDFLGFAARGEAHSIHNSGSEPLLMFAARVNLAQDVCDYPHQGKRLYMNGEEEVLVDVTEVRRA